jgi:hypothetical protein
MMSPREAPPADMQGWYSLFPLSNETTNSNIVGWTALVGGTLFEAGAYCMVVEALNRGHTVRFGYEVGFCLIALLTLCLDTCSACCACGLQQNFLTWETYCTALGVYPSNTPEQVSRSL